MADPAARWHDNVPGPVYIDDSCIICSMCADLAPEHFRMSDDEDHDICYRQPTTPEGWAAVREAADACPTESIGLDGQGTRPTR
ncbi:MAG: ferredoxin [Alphaproteobacteria bacterium]|nr:ferredoxin [Alphaproteobacteria bacterium]